MKLGADGVITNQFNQALFIMRNDTRTWATPGGAVEAGELPTETVEREVEEETGLKVRAVRLVGLYYRQEKPDGNLLFTFRCIQRGGEIAASDESPRVGFLPVVPLPQPMLSLHRERVERALNHTASSPYWGLQQLPRGFNLLRSFVYGARDLARSVRRQPPVEPAPEWKVGAFVIIRNDEGRVLWVRRNDYDVWNLPGGGRQGQEPPWETAVRETREETGLQVQLTHLSGVYAKPEKQEVILTFTAEAAGGALTPNSEAAEFRYFAAGEEPPNALPKHVERVADAVGPGETTFFRRQSGSTSLERLEEFAPN